MATPLHKVVRRVLRYDIEYIDEVCNWDNDYDYGHKDRCVVCGKETKRFQYWANYCCCSSCSREVKKAVLTAFNMKSYYKKLHSKGVRYGYKLAYTDHCKATVTQLNTMVDKAKQEDRKVFMLGRDMDAFYTLYQLEDTVVYLSGWNREFCHTGDTKKKAVVEYYDIKDGDIVVDTGFVGSILADISHFVSIEGYLLSADTRSSWPGFRTGEDYQYRDWICSIEHNRRARETSLGSSAVPNEMYCNTNNLRYESGFFSGFRAGAKAIMMQ